MDTLLNYFEQDEHEASLHFQEILAGTLPIIDDDDNDNEEIPTAVAKKCNTHKKFDGPKFADLYPPVQGTICAPSVEAKLHGTWSKWAEYCEFSSYPGEPWAATMFGLGLFPHGCNLNNPNNWDRERTDGFFNWLKDIQQAKTVVKNAKTFINIHIQCEYFCRLHATTGYASLSSTFTFNVSTSAASMPLQVTPVWLHSVLGNHLPSRICLEPSMPAPPKLSWTTVLTSKPISINCSQHPK
jgi:hypothetical protein